MKVNVEHVNNHEITLTITVDAKDVTACVNQAIKTIASQVNIPGFRKGKAPRKVLEMNYGKDAILGEAFETIVNKYYGEALVKENLDPVTLPKVETVNFKEGEECVFKATFTQKPEVTLGEYKNLDVAKDKVEVSEELVQEQLKNIQNQFATMVVAPEGSAIENGDFAVIDFKGTIDGVAFDGGEGKSYPLEIGSGSFIPGFEEQLIGAKVGDDVVVKVAFPEDYGMATLAGKDSEFAVHVHDIKRKQLPELNDELAKEVSAYETFAELEADLRKQLQNNLERQAEEKYMQALVELAVSNATVDIPEVMIEDKESEMVQELDMRLQSQGSDLATYLQMMGRSVEDLKKDYHDAAAKSVRHDLVLEAIAKAENITVSNEDMNFEIIMMAQQFGADPKEVFDIIVKENRIGMLRRTVTMKKAVRFIVDHAKGAEAK